MERESFLAEIAASLGRPRRRVPPVRSQVWPQAAELTPAELAQNFRRELEQVAGEVVLARSAEEACAVLAAELRGARQIVSWARAELSGACGLDLTALWHELGERCCEPHAADFRAAALRADVGVTGVDYAVADTGTLVLSAAVGRPRTVSLLPRLHVALVRERQLVARMGGSFAGYRPDTPSAVHYITGPSRTSDIENDLSIGVHGPARVLAIVIAEAAP
jgi:L-lactate dehydrogenase complex protein LldG